jgi:hypothetical protein
VLVEVSAGNLLVDCARVEVKIVWPAVDFMVDAWVDAILVAPFVDGTVLVGIFVRLAVEISDEALVIEFVVGVLDFEVV